MNQLVCPFRTNIRWRNGSELADCALIQQQVAVPGLPAVVDRNTCEICSASSRAMGLTNAVLPSLLFGACDDALRSGRVPAHRLPHIQSLQQRAEAQLQHQSQKYRFEQTHACDVFICCQDANTATRRAINSLLDQHDAIAIVHLIEDGGCARQLLDEYSSRWNVFLHQNARPLGLFASVHKFFTACRTQFLAFQTPSSISHPDRIGESVSALVRAGAELFAAGVERPSGICLPNYPDETFARFLSLDSFAMRRATFADMGGFANRPDADAEFVYRAFCEGRRFALSNECLVESAVENVEPPGTRPRYENRHRSLRHHAVGLGAQSVACDVVIPFRDHLSMLRESIESVLAQEHADVLIHLIDDDSSSSERTDEVLRYWSSHPRIRTYRNSCNIGQYASFNNVSEFFETDLAVVQDADDVSLSHRVHAAGNLLRLSDADFYGAAEYLFDVEESSSPTDGVAVRESYYPPSDQVWYFALNPTVAFRTLTFNLLNGYADFGEPEKNRAGLDSEFQARAWFGGTRFAISRQVVARHRIHPDSATRNTRTGWGTRLRAQSIEECKRRRRLFQNGFDPRVFGAKNRYREITRRWP